MKHTTLTLLNRHSVVYPFKRSMWILTFFLMASLSSLHAGSFVRSEALEGSFPLVRAGVATDLCVSSDDFAGVQRVAGHLQSDILAVTGVAPEIWKDTIHGQFPVIIGTLGESALIASLVDTGALDVSALEGRWDMYHIQTIDHPMDGVEQALIIVGSNKRGTIYGMYELSRACGVSPWYWWADVPVQEKAELFVVAGVHTRGEPKIKYRGIFLNDEAPALSGWARETFGGFNHKFYEKVYELILRNGGNYLWPAMWPPTAFFDDDPENYILADEMGVVISTSHHEPMMRSHEEWSRFGGGAWNYETNKEQLQEFWRTGFERMYGYEGVTTMGMRGDGDEAMSEGTAIELLQDIISDQRSIIEDVTGKPATETPQVWALYKEVQDYWDKGMRVPDDVMVLLCDDNWGNVRILPKKEDWNREGGFGIYYHFDFVGGPVSYRWINVTQIEKVWEQMNLCWEWGVHDLWLVNVGDLKPMELPISFFLDMAWNPDAIEAKDLPNYYVDWATEQFGEAVAPDVAEMLARLTKYSARRTPEMLKPETYSLFNYREADRVVEDYRDLVARAQSLYDNLPETHKSAFYQLVLFPAAISCNLNEMYVAAAKNKLFGEQGRGSANYYAEQTKSLFERDAELTRYYHEELAGGKWNHMMAQTHIGYTYWNNPPVNMMPAVSWTQERKNPGLGVTAEMWSGRGPQKLPTFDPLNDQNYFIEIYNTGSGSLNYNVEAAQDWIQLSSDKGSVKFEDKVYVTIDWDLAPEGAAMGEVVVTSGGAQAMVLVPIRNEKPGNAGGFIENNGVVAIDAANFCNSTATDGVQWTVIPNLGRTGSAVTVEPANADPKIPGQNAPSLEYEFTTWQAGEVQVHTHLMPTLNFKKNEGLKFAIAVDDEAPQVINLHEGELVPDWEYPDWWNNSVTDHVKIKLSKHHLKTAGAHTLKIWMIDPGVVFQRFVIDAGGLKPSYLGPQESVKVD